MRRIGGEALLRDVREHLRLFVAVAAAELEEASSTTSTSSFILGVVPRRISIMVAAVLPERHRVATC